MPKVIVEESKPEIGPLPKSPKEFMEGNLGGGGSGTQSNSRSTGSDEPKEVNPAFAGDLAGLTFEAIHMVLPPWRPMTRDEKEVIGEPLAEMLTKWGLGGKIGKAEVVLIFYFSKFTVERVQDVMVYYRKKKIEEEMVQKGPEEKGI